MWIVTLDGLGRREEMLRWRHGPRTPHLHPRRARLPRPDRGRGPRLVLGPQGQVRRVLLRGGEDCRPTSMCRLRDGREGIVVFDACRPIPWDKVLDVASPDGGAHVCGVPSRNGGGALVLCVVLGGSV